MWYNQIFDLACSVAELHSSGIVHGNLHVVSYYSLFDDSFSRMTTQDNVLISDELHACVVDAYVNTLLRETVYTGNLPVPTDWPYKSPEELLHGSRNFQTDVYSFACVVYSVSSTAPLVKLTSLFIPLTLDVYREATLQMHTSQLREGRKPYNTTRS